MIESVGSLHPDDMDAKGGVCRASVAQSMSGLLKLLGFRV